MGALSRKDGPEIFETTLKIAERYKVIKKDWCGMNLLPLTASWVGAMDLGLMAPRAGESLDTLLSQAQKGKFRAVYLLGADDIDTRKLQNTFVIYQGHHGDKGAGVADIIFPSAAYTEKDGLYLNCEGRLQRSFRAIPAPGDAREDWRILKNLLESLGHAIPEENEEDVRRSLETQYPHLQTIFQKPDCSDDFETKKTPAAPLAPTFRQEALRSPIENFYQTDSITRNSPLMARCTQVLLPLLGHQKREWQ
jgi:NADH-quinone oxidoreductase subunit G